MDWKHPADRSKPGRMSQPSAQYVSMDTSMGSITFELYVKEAPKTVTIFDLSRRFEVAEPELSQPKS